MCWSCENPKATYEDFLDELRRRIACHGWEVMTVAHREPHRLIAYTAGLAARGLPELVVTGLPNEPACQLLHGFAELSVGGAPLAPGGVARCPAGTVRLVALPHPDVHLPVAASLAGPSLSALQLVWPDPQGHFPWEQAYQGGRGGQPVLGPRDLPADGEQQE